MYKNLTISLFLAFGFTFFTSCSWLEEQICGDSKVIKKWKCVGQSPSLTQPLDLPPKIGTVRSKVFSDTDNVYSIGEMVRIDVTEEFKALDIVNTTIKIISASQGYDAGIQNLTPDKDAFMYHWDTTGLKPARDYVVEVTLTDAKGQTTRNNLLTIALALDPPMGNNLVSQLDIAVPGQGLSMGVQRTYLLDSTFDGPLGFGWTHTYLAHIVKTPDGLVKVFNPDGTGSFFKPGGNGAYKPPLGDRRSLQQNTDNTFVLKSKSGTQLEFNLAGTLMRIQDRNGNAITLSYNPLGRLRTATDSSGQVLVFSYDENNRLISITDPAGRTVSYTYDAQGNLASFKDMGGAITTYTYDTNHNLITVTSSTDKRRMFIVNTQDRLEEVLHDDGVNRFIYQRSDTVPEITMTDALGGKTAATFNENGLITKVIDPLGRTVTTTYDADTNITSSTDANGNRTLYTYDTRGNILTMMNAMGQAITYTYEPRFDMVASITDQAGRTTTFNYDAKGNLTTITYPDSSTERFTYDVTGNLTSKADRKGQTIAYTYESRGLLTSKTFPDGTSVRFAYDTAGNLRTATDQDGDLSFAYDLMGRMITVQYPSGHNVFYQYNKDGQMSQMTYPDATILGYRYDSANRLAEIVKFNQTLVRYHYDANARVTQRDLLNGISTTYAYDAASQFMNIVNRQSNGNIFSRFDYTYDNVGNRLTMTSLSGTTHYVYDPLNQLIRVEPPNVSPTTYNFDPTGNRQASTEGTNTTMYTTNSLNQYTHIGSDSYTYDLNGNLTQKTTAAGTTAYSYDFENRLIRVQSPSETITYAYDPLGRRTSKTTTSGTVRYFYDGLRVIMETDGSGTLQASYIYGLGIDDVLVMKRDNRDSFYSHDGLGSVTDLTDATGAVVESYAYDAYGIPSRTSAIGNPYLFTGREYELESRLYYYRARYYDPILGRFLSPDPIKFLGGIHFYSYAYNNPINNVDPLGHSSRPIYIPIIPPIPNITPIAITQGGGPEEPETGLQQYNVNNSTYTVTTSTYTVTSTYYPNFQNNNANYEVNSGNSTVKQDYSSYNYGYGVNSGNSTAWQDYRPYYRGDPTFLQASERPTRDRYIANRLSNTSHGLVAKISIPSEDSLVRAMVPVFGYAHGQDFKEYRVEYGKGPEPMEWIPIAISSRPQIRDAATTDLDDSSDKTIHGNLATWDTGLRSYVYGDEYAKDHPINLNGVYTVRLVVVNHRGETAEDRVTVEVGEVIPAIYGGIVLSHDEAVSLSVPEQAIAPPFRVLSITPVTSDHVRLPEGYDSIGVPYEVRPSGEQFTKDVTLVMRLPKRVTEAVHVDRMGIYLYRSDGGLWEHFPSSFDSKGSMFHARVRGFPKGRVYVALLERSHLEEQIALSPWAEESFQGQYKPIFPPSWSAKPVIVPIPAPAGEWIIHNTFEDGVGGWENRDGDVGAALSLNNLATDDGGYALQLTDRKGGGNFAATITKTPFDAELYPIIQFDYRIHPDVKINLLAKMDDRWYDIEFTDDPKQYRRLNMERIGKIKGVQRDDKWHHARLNLHEMLKNHPPLQHRDSFIIQELIFADWDSAGYMKLVFGHNPKGATYYIDNFMVRDDTKKIEKVSEMLDSASLISILDVPFMPPATNEHGPRMMTPPIKFDQGKNDLLSNWQAFLSEGKAGLFYSDQFKGVMKLSRGQDNQNPDGEPFITLRYDVTRAGEYAGYYHLLGNMDVRQFKTLSFWVRGTRGQEVVRVGIKNSKGQETKIVVGAYMEKGIGTHWQKVSIPLAAFPFLKESTLLENISVTFEQDQGSTHGEVSVKGMAFENQPGSLSVIGFQNRSGRNAWGQPFSTFKAGRSRIEVLPDDYGVLIHYNDIISSRDEESWAGLVVDLHGVDVSTYEAITFNIKRVHGTERPHLYLGDGKERQFVDLGRYLMPTLDWQQIRIPLSDFIALGIDLKRLTNLSLVFEWEAMSGAFYVNQVRFEDSTMLLTHKP